jgi:hypothetical protein
VHFGLRYVGDGELVLHGFSEFDWVGSASDRRSTSRCCFSLGSGMISCSAESRLLWHSVQQRQNIWQPVLLVVKPSGFASY